MRDINVLGTALQPCSGDQERITGFDRSGMCKSHSSDAGSHHVCLDASKRVGGRNLCDHTGQSDWCKDVGNWCACEWAFAKLVAKVGCDAVPDVQCDATNRAALEHYKRRKDEPEVSAALECLASLCGTSGVR